jgi:hypothetical protein
MQGRSQWSGLVVLACLALTPAVGVGQTTVVVPNSLAAADGNQANVFPFNCGYNSLSSQRYQQVYSGVEVGSGRITQIRFRQEAEQEDGDARQDDDFELSLGPINIPNVTITLSTTSAAVDALSTTFANNVGADVTTVFNGTLTLSSATCSSSPCPFDIVIPLSNSFEFDGSVGNLLLDVSMHTCVDLGWFRFDANLDYGDSVSRTYTTSSGGVSSTEADGVDTGGLVTQFIFSSGAGPAPVPTPALSYWGMVAATLMLLSLGFVTMRRRLRT